MEWYEIYEVDTEERIRKIDEDARLGLMQVTIKALATYPPNKNAIYYYIKDNEGKVQNVTIVKKYKRG